MVESHSIKKIGHDSSSWKSCIYFCLVGYSVAQATVALAGMSKTKARLYQSGTVIQKGRYFLDKLSVTITSIALCVIRLPIGD